MIPAHQSVSGNIEIVIDPDYVTEYTATDGSTATDTVVGVLVHELGHAVLTNRGDPTQAEPSTSSENAARRLTNPVREELDLKPEMLFPEK